MGKQYNSTKRGGEDRFMDFSINGTDLPANTPQYLTAPEDGFLRELRVVVQSAVTTGGTITVKTPVAGGGGGSSSTFANTVSGLQTAVASGQAAGTTGAISQATSGDEVTPRIKKGDSIQVVPTGFATAGAVRCELVYNTALPVS